MTPNDRHPELDEHPHLSSPPIVTVDQLTVYQGSHPAVENVSFELFPGTDTAIVGPNGAGKSTLVKAVLGLIPSKGRIRIFGRSLDQLGQLRHLIGYVPQSFDFDRTFPLSVEELVGLGWVDMNLPDPATEHQRSPRPRRSVGLPVLPWKTHPEKKAAIARALEQVGMSHMRHHAIGTLSGGELKRTLLAYCLVMPRRLLVLDEAFAGVDAQGESDFHLLLHRLRHDQNWTILQVSHDLDMVSRYCDRVLCLNRTLVCQGQPDITLSPENLLNAYGPAFSRYQHHHH